MSHVMPFGGALSTSGGQPTDVTANGLTLSNRVPKAGHNGTHLVTDANGRPAYLSGSGRILIGPHAGTSLLEWALKYAEHGYHVFPLRDGSKFPLKNCQMCERGGDFYERDKHQGDICTAHSGPSSCHGHLAATRDADIIRARWMTHPYANIGIHVGRSGIAVPDIDTRAKADGTRKIGGETIAALEASHGALPDGPRVRTWSGGWQHYMTHPNGMLLKSSAGRDDIMTGLGQDVDVKALSAYVVAPPSLITGKRDSIVQGQYTWVTNPWGSRPDIPAWIPQVIAEREASKRPVRVYPSTVWKGEQATGDQVRDRVLALADDVARMREGARNDTLFRKAAMAFDYERQIDPDEVEGIFVSAGLSSGLDYSETIRTVTSARNRPNRKAYTWRTAGNPAPTSKNAAEGATREGQPDVDETVEIPEPRTEGVDAAERGPRARIELLSTATVYARKPDQMGAAELYIKDCDGGYPLRWNGQAERFYHYDDGCWREDDKRDTRLGGLVDSLGRKVTALVDRDIDSMKKEMKDGEGDAEMLKELIKIRPNWYKTYRNAGGRAGIVHFIRTNVGKVGGDQMDADPHLLNFVNGTYDVRTGQLRTPAPEDYVTHRADREIDMSLADRPLEEVAPYFYALLTRACAAPTELSDEARKQRVAAVSRSLGAMLHGECVDKAMMVYEGAPDTGKTQLLEVVKDCLGPQLAVTTEPKLLIKTKGDRHESIEFALKGRRMALLNELSQHMTLDDNQVLRHVNPNGATFSVRKLREQKEDIRLTWNIAATTNELPRARVTPQVLRRLRIFPMSQVSIPEDEQFNITEKILSKETAAVLAHLVKWWREWYAQQNEGGSGLIVTDEMRKALSEFEEDNATLVDQFRDEMTTQDSLHGMVRTNDIWGRYTSWHATYHPNEKLEYGVNRKQFWNEVLAWPGVQGVYKSNGTRPDGTPKQTLVGIKGIRIFSSPNEDIAS